MTDRAGAPRAAPPARGTTPGADGSPAARLDRPARRVLRVLDMPGRVGYREGLAAQRRLARERIEGRAGADLLLLVEHDPVVTLGRGARQGNVTAPAGLLRDRGVDVVEIERGGDVTYHGPGQLVGYPILDLRRWRRDLHWYVRRLEEALILGLSELGLEAFRAGGHTGVWVGAAGGDVPEAEAPAAIASGAIRKVASIGVHVSRWVTWHGFALNVTEAPLENFGLIVPCGIEGVRMTSLASEGVLGPAGGEASGGPAPREGSAPVEGSVSPEGAVPPEGAPAPVAAGGPVRRAVAAGFARAFEAEVETWSGRRARATLGPGGREAEVGTPEAEAGAPAEAE